MAMSGLIVGLILAAGAVFCFAVMRVNLYHQVDDQLRLQAQFTRQVALDQGKFPSQLPPLPKNMTQGAAPYAQLIHSDGSLIRPQGDARPLQVTRADLAVAQGRRGDLQIDREVHGDRVRVLTVAVPGLGAAQLGRSLASVDSALASLRLVLAVLVLAGLALAVGAGRLFSRSVLAPLGDLMQTTAHIQSTGDLSLRVDESRTDEAGLLASSFNAMLEQIQSARDALSQSTSAQRQLVADASHELRTPVAGLRTNIEVLLTDDAGNPDREALMADVIEQIDELSAIVSDLIELARGDQEASEDIECDLADITREALARARLHAPGLRYESDVVSWPMVGSPERLGRAVNNVIDNAAKFSPRGATVLVTLRAGVLIVRDEGPGVPRHEIPHIFDRFFRGRSTSNLHGSGLGLAIVKQVVETHGGTVSARAADGGGLEVALELPGAPDGDPDGVLSSRGTPVAGGNAAGER
jgi:two-component system sensor histidine kinase MprB